MTPEEYLLQYLPEDIVATYEFHNYKHALTILANDFPDQFADIIEVLRDFKLKRSHLLASGGNESKVPKAFSSILRPKDWVEKKMIAKMVVDGVDLDLDTHKVDYIKGRVALDLEWNSKDQTYDRDLYAFRSFHEYNKISVGVLITRSVSLNSIFRQLGIMAKYGASTTQMGKLLPRLNAGRNGGCPVLAIGITDKQYFDDSADGSSEGLSGFYRG